MTSETTSTRTLLRQKDPSSDVSITATPLTRRAFGQVVGAGLLITVTERLALGQRRSRGRGRGSRGAANVAARLHINRDGTITVLTGKVEEGQGSRTQITQAAAEELRVDISRVTLIMADTDLVPDDGITAGSRTTPSTVPSIRRGAAMARRLLVQLAARKWNVDANRLEVQDGTIVHRPSKKSVRYADFAQSPGLIEAFKQNLPSAVDLTPAVDWNVIGISTPRPNLRDLVTGKHQYPSDIARPGMRYGKILRPPAYQAVLESIDLTAARELKDVVVVQEGSFIGFVAPTTFQAEAALKAVETTARWKHVAQPSSDELADHLRRHARTGRPRTTGSIDSALAQAARVLKATYTAAYVQHAPMEPRAATAEWNDGKLTVWTGVDGPQRVQSELAREFGVPTSQVRVIVPDMGGGFGGKHTGEAAAEAARLARAVQAPVAVHWTRKEEFTWAYFRPGTVIDCQAGLNDVGTLVAWDFTNINAGSSAIDTPYAVANTRTLSVGSESPLRQGSYRCLAATVNNFARESFMDELAAAAQADPLEYRLAHLDNPRLKTVLKEAAEHFDWPGRKTKVTRETGIGLACGTEKDSVVAACVEVGIDSKKGEIHVRHVCEAFECGPVYNPANLESQVQGCIMMGMGPALREEIEFDDGRILNPHFSNYLVPRFSDMPTIDVRLVKNPDIPSAGGGETPIIAIAPAIANAVFAATGLRIRSMPIKLPDSFST